MQYATYILHECARSSRLQVAQQIARDIQEREAQSGRSVEGADVASIDRHIALHILHPAVKVPEIIRELDGLRRRLHGSLTNVCPDTGNSVIDTGNVALYLKVVREIQQVYKMGDTAKLSLGGVKETGPPIASDL
jgi:hypothetical protein